MSTPLAASPAVRGRLIRVNGAVQGVGFRPTVWRIATALGLTGHVRNDAAGVEIALWCSDAELAAFRQRLTAECPPLARIDAIQAVDLEGVPPADGFAIAASAGGQVRTSAVPDAACCPQCLAEILDPGDRRYFYPFANCTHCGPRLSIIEAIPYDRASTSMKSFIMCEECRAEYENPADRRFHAQPIACPACGPRIWLEDQTGVAAEGASQAVIRRAAALIASGRIVAVKGVGGFHLACDATDDDAVARLRGRKRREAKPLALMARDLRQIGEFAGISAAEREALASRAAPIVLLRSRGDRGVAAGVALGNDRLGFMLPYTPLHHLLMRAFDRPIVLTSANRSGEPQCTDNDEAKNELGGIADHWLMHDRAIVNRLDDSVVRCDRHGVSVLRRARGLAPEEVAVPDGFDGSRRVFAAGGDLKAAFCLAGNGKALLSQHLGDLEERKSEQAWRDAAAIYRSIFDARPDIVVTDLHPGYRSTRIGLEFARETGARLVQIQHHHAHLASCIAQHGRALDAPSVLGVILDGTGFGEDDTIWGGEFLLGDYRRYERLAHFDAVAMPGGDRASREPWRNAYAHLRAAFGPDFLAGPAGGLPFARALAERQPNVVAKMIERGVNTPLASSAGRLFDACAAILGTCFELQSYEGQAGMELEALANPFIEAAEAWALPSDNGSIIRWRSLWEALLRDMAAAVETGLIAARFHRTLIAVVSRTARRLARENEVDTIALSGGVFQNRIMLEGVSSELSAAGFEVLAHKNVPGNDGGLALGQAMIGLAALG
ncbi:carbamoyltransferase HypF [Mesorhizobium sp. WSM4906]|uniref:carbamoyltransferase HypF n=1 Tax=Mesorhizobium sp. WSM4906 TaxID=3038546 RepID=UPI002416AEDF|nr:carbamoyltransferase HypF [Mesorhizobium sp. WSM4906]WFP76142.1 carbamoyltransferase HypF [Mesorhizobium sp. WSM4906]